MDLGALGGGLDELDEFVAALLGVKQGLDLGVPNTAVADVVHDRVVEEHTVLRDDGDVGAQVVQTHEGDVLTVDEDLALVNVVEPV